jgi:hypothetical protein
MNSFGSSPREAEEYQYSAVNADDVLVRQASDVRLQLRLGIPL